ncbi:MAG: M56 family metallopeptidase [Flavobacteriaceae bacterium]
MEAFLEYLLKASGILVIFYLIYHLLLKKETFFEINRHFLLSGLLIALVLPLVSITKYIDPVPLAYGSNVPLAEGYSTINQVASFNWITILSYTYIAGLVFFGVKFAIQLLSLRTMIKDHPLRKEGGFVFVETTKEIAPFSFFNYIFYNPSMYDASELESILQHEKAHSLQWHSLDVVLAHLITVLLWMNPLGWLYKNNIKQNLEFLADASAAKDVSSIKAYQYTLLRVSGVPYCQPITNSFYNSLIKKRIVMLHKSKSRKRNLFKYVLVLPLLLAFVLVFNVETVASPLPITEQYSFTDNFGVYEDGVYLITKETTDEEIEALVKEIKNDGGILSIKKVKRNSEGLITSIKLTLKAGKSMVEGAYSNEDGIPPVHFGKNEGGVFITGGDNSRHEANSFHFDTDHDTDHDGDYDIHVERSGHGEAHGNVWVSSKDGDVQRIEIEEVNGKKVIRVDGKEVTEEELKELEKKNGFTHKSAFIKSSGSGGRDDVRIFISDDDDGKDIKVVSKEGDGFFFIDTDGDKDPLYLIDGKEASKDEVMELSPKQIESMNVYKDKKAIEKYGKKAKDGVIEIRTKKDD